MIQKSPKRMSVPGFCKSGHIFLLQRIKTSKLNWVVTYIFILSLQMHTINAKVSSNCITPSFMVLLKGKITTICSLLMQLLLKLTVYHVESYSLQLQNYSTLRLLIKTCYFTCKLFKPLITYHHLHSCFSACVVLLFAEITLYLVSMECAMRQK